ncbi:hypothetical protein E5E91_10470 [Deinococcus radiodurans R1 = ATCC 13939 = DSM 20539]|nr:hypothetical protein DXG80_06385 [Deinococcus radiodurans]UDL01075.1 hypothetical protein E5E91_10470 [Deinococcus radiodurans R1 = ATCC 13939 = DSM 20539]
MCRAPLLIRFQIESRACPGAILRGAHGKNTVLRRWTVIRRLSGCSGIGLKPYQPTGCRFDAPTAPARHALSSGSSASAAHT